MINLKMLLQRTHSVRRKYKRLALEDILPFDNESERKKFNKLFISLPLFVRLACEALDDNNKFLTDIEISILEGFITNISEFLDFVDNKQYDFSVANKDAIGLEKIYLRTTQLANDLDNIKPIVRGFYVQPLDMMDNPLRTNEINALILKAQNMQETLTSKLAILDEKLDIASNIIGTTTAKLDDITKYQETLNKVGSKYQNTLSRLNIESESLAQKKIDLTVAHELLNNVRKTYEANDNSLKELNKDLSKLQSSVSTMESRAAKVENELNQKTAGIDLIMTQANAALETSTTVSVGGFFKDQYDISKRWMFTWPILALLFLGGAIWICFDTLKYMRPGTLEAGTELSYLIARFCIAPLFLLGAWFCTNQYIKQKNITEDYAYKKVLSLSLIGFKSEIEKTGEANTTGFIKSLLKEILRSPLETLDKKHYKRETKLLKLAHDEMIANMFKNVTSKKNEPDEDKK